jgi:hypothetical protein
MLGMVQYVTTSEASAKTRDDPGTTALAIGHAIFVQVDLWLTRLEAFDISSQICLEVYARVLCYKSQGSNML